ncbi:MAG: holin [Comamonas sp.]|jgi:uncharacterized membrane protein YebE (DUF533 family)|uniref:holin n=1 Tax=Comamonas sp. TaxID=34028 RepID=UPI0028177905|nr:holin [Comamonas sp.]MDR0215895.1 holin [Comamonas sp.]
MNIETLETVGTVANKTAVGGGLVSGWAWLTSNEVLGLLGAIAALGGLAVTWYYKRESSRRQAAESALRQERERLRIQEQQMRIDLMRATGNAVPHADAHGDDSDMAPLEVD